MTRYTRAKGSKASNERTPNEATPWHVMKEQLEDNQAKNQKPIEKVKTAKELLKESEDLSHDASQNTWVEFEEVKSQKAKKKIKQQGAELSKPLKAIKKKKPQIKKIKSAENSEDISQSIPSEKSEEGAIKKKVKKKKNKDSASKPVEQSTNSVQVQNVETATTSNKKRKLEVKNEETVGTHPDVLTKRQKRNLKKKNKTPDTNENPGKEQNGNNEQRKPFPQKFNKDFPNRQNGFNNDYNTQPPKKLPKHNHTTPAKVRDNQEHARRKPDEGPTKLIINGIEVELVKYNGFPIRKEDAERLKDLRQQMVMKGIPKKAIEAAMKLERRRAEKALARIRREVCFHCRKAGHILSDCPELGVEQSGTGICFKCGSTEHTHFECKVTRGAEYRFASCFICREQGHIAKQCPDNPKGIYPQGGACKLCGDVTHLKKDCPDLIKEKEETALTVDTITGDALESLDNEKKKTDGSEEKSKNKKVVKF